MNSRSTHRNSASRPMQLRMLKAALAVAVALSGLTDAASPLHAAPTVDVPAGIDHAPWDQLLKRYVNDRGLVDYATWKSSSDDLLTLDHYLAAFAATTSSPATGDAEIAALINAYNAITIRWMLDHYPTESIRKTRDAWTGRRWNVGGGTVSLDEIEHQNLRPLLGWKVHATIVCAARSCPPLQRDAYTAANLAPLIAQAWRAWLGREDLNHFDVAKNTVHVSPIFKWFKDDFTGDGALAKVLETYGPEAGRTFFRTGGFDVDYLDYHWGLNDQGTIGEDYSGGLAGFFRSVF